MNSPSIAGTSQTTRRWSAKAVAEVTGSRSMRHLRDDRRVLGRRRLDAGAERGEPERALDVGRHRPRAVAFREGDLLERGAAQPAPGRQERDRLDQVGLAGAVRPDQHDAPTRCARDSCGSSSASGGGCGRQSCGAVTTSAPETATDCDLRGRCGTKSQRLTSVEERGDAQV